MGSWLEEKRVQRCCDIAHRTPMPPRIPILTCLRASKPSAPTQFALPLRPFSSSTIPQGKFTERTKKRASQDPYIITLRNRKKAANLSRRSELDQKRVIDLGDPVRGVKTPFIESLDTGKPLSYPPEKKVPRDESHLNYALRPETLERSLAESIERAVPRDVRTIPKATTYPWSQYTNSSQRNQQEQPEETEATVEERRKQDHERASQAIARITALDNGSSKDRMRVNIARCVSTFGRHNTDKIFPPRAPPLETVNTTTPHPVRPETNIEATKRRVGADTGSSEVQIAILTAKIKTVADFLATRGRNDKHNKRNLRLLVHRRQKLLQYLRRKERGGPRWQHCIETLGLTEGTWRGEISL